MNGILPIDKALFKCGFQKIVTSIPLFQYKSHAYYSQPLLNTLFKLLWQPLLNSFEYNATSLTNLCGQVPPFPLAAPLKLHQLGWEVSVRNHFQSRLSLVVLRSG